MLHDIVKIGILTSKDKIRKSISGYLLTIVLNEDYSFQSLEIEQFQPERIGRYLYQEGASKGNKTSPIAPLTEAQKTLIKITKWFESCLKLQDINPEDQKVFQKIYETLINNEQNIINSIQEKIKDISKKESKFLTIKLQDKYLGDIEIFQRIYYDQQESKTKKTIAKEKICSICGQIKENVYARTSVYNFDTDDKPGFITGFKKDNYWKNIPVCEDCRESLKIGRDFIENKLSFKFYGLKYQLIIKTLSDNQEVLQEIINILKDSEKSISLKQKIVKKITDDEDEVLEYLSEQKDDVSFNFLFIQVQQSAERILLLIEDVLPSRLKKIFEAKSYVDKLYTNQNDQKFNFGKIRIFFNKSDVGKKNRDLDKYFLEIIDSTFIGKSIDFSFLVKFYMQVIRREFTEDGYYFFRIRDALMCSSFFEKLQLIQFQEVHMEKGQFDEFFAKYGKSFNTPEKRGIFLLGVLTEMLLRKQYSERNSKPFMKKLKNLKMNEIDIKGLLAEIQNKFEEYDAFDKGKRIIAQESAKYLLQAGENWKMSVDEINYYFACGMNLSEEIAKEVYQN